MLAGSEMGQAFPIEESAGEDNLADTRGREQRTRAHSDQLTEAALLEGA